MRATPARAMGIHLNAYGAPGCARRSTWISGRIAQVSAGSDFDILFSLVCRMILYYPSPNYPVSCRMGAGARSLYMLFYRVDVDVICVLLTDDACLISVRVSFYFLFKLHSFSSCLFMQFCLSVWYYIRYRRTVNRFEIVVLSQWCSGKRRSHGVSGLGGRPRSGDESSQSTVTLPTSELRVESQWSVLDQASGTFLMCSRSD